jgi:hypothetical protein
MKKTLIILIFFFTHFAFSHNINYNKVILRHWVLEKEHLFVDGSFYMLKNENVYIELANDKIVHFPISSFSKEDQAFVLKKNEWINVINNDVIAKNTTLEDKIQPSWNKKLWSITMVIFILGLVIFTFTDKKKVKYILPILVVGGLMIVFGFAKRAMLTTTDPAFVNSAFIPFKSAVSTSYDATYFYVNSKGIPNHEMMVGISSTGWQQQVPIPQCYISSYINKSGNQNSWSIPLNPIIATTPVPVNKDHFAIGAIAIAANGVAIFNLYTTSGQDSYATGQLDNYGGHCGKGDDYHYHTAPLHLISSGQTPANLPIAFGLDGFAVYGGLEPDGSTMTTLDTNHGHYGTNGVYHYHGTQNSNGSKPLMIVNMVGVITEDANKQLIPQPQASPMRGGNLTPLSGALITSCVPNGTNNGYNLAYSLNSVPGYATNYSWNGTIYTFNYVTPTVTTTTNYNGFSQCTVPNLGFPEFALNDSIISLYPNPASDILNIKINNGSSESDIQLISIYGTKGELISKTMQYKPTIDIKNLSQGTYLVKIQFSNYLVTKKVMVK